VIVDDVFTTGATAKQLARTLRQAGVEKVSLAAVARV
jgi:predicted amidophosphoribosyltransferase